MKIKVREYGTINVERHFMLGVPDGCSPEMFLAEHGDQCTDAADEAGVDFTATDTGDVLPVDSWSLADHEFVVLDDDDVPTNADYLENIKVE